MGPVPVYKQLHFKEEEMKNLNGKLQQWLAMTGFAVLVVGLMVAGGCAKSEETTAETAAVAVAKEETSEEPAFLLVQSSKGFTYDDGRLTVLGTSPTTTFFSDRPHRIAGHMSLEKAYAWGHPSFAENPPNATLSNLRHGEMANVVLTLRNTVLEGNTISWDVDILEGELPLVGGPNTLFIDVIGRPLTPVSVAGHNRRTRRRSLAVGAVVGASVANNRDDESDYAAQQSAAAASDAAAAADDAADAANQAAASAQYAAGTAGSAPSVEQQLKDLKDLLDQGLITQDDYDAKKEEILAGM
jgi:hypothetical protein